MNKLEFPQISIEKSARKEYGFEKFSSYRGYTFERYSSSAEWTKYTVNFAIGINEIRILTLSIQIQETEYEVCNTYEQYYTFTKCVGESRVQMTKEEKQFLEAEKRRCEEALSSNI